LASSRSWLTATSSIGSDARMERLDETAKRLSSA